MNIFYLDECPVQSAQWMCDKHVVKMILETAQLLCTAHRIIDGIETQSVSKTGRAAKRWILSDEREPILYTATHINHPSAVWCRETRDNYKWLVNHFYALCDEYTYRYGKTHKTTEIAKWFEVCPEGLEEVGFYEPPSCMAEEYVVSCSAVKNYRNYYKLGKAALHSWTDREPPVWIEG